MIFTLRNPHESKILPQPWLRPPRGVLEKTSLPAGEVHIWWAYLRAGSAALCAGWDLLSEEEKQVAMARRLSRARREFVLTRALLRQILARYVGGAPAELRFDSSTNGKPVLRGIQSVHFNASHSRDVCFIAVAHGPVGIDVEYVQPEALRQSEIEQYLSPSELGHLDAMPVQARGRALYACWTQKEAVLKALGIGLLFPPRLVNAFADGANFHVISLLGRNWLVRQIPAPPGHTAAAAVERTNVMIRWRQWRIPLEATLAQSRAGLPRPHYG
jgi:4'-phosphopantetheinyl transferase